ncbi:MAG: hypothetical protein ACF8NJ_01140 [Phycisphaerales bacterium JB038]
MTEHPELRLETVDLSELPRRNRSRCPSAPGSYEWWRFEAVDPGARTGCVVTLHNGLAFSPQYRRQVTRHYDGAGAGRPELIWPDAHPAVSIAVFHDGKSLRRSDLLYRSGAFVETGEPWSARIGPNLLEETPSGWKLSFRGTPWSLGLGGPQLHPDEEIQVELEFRRHLESPTLERAYLPEQRRVPWPSRRDIPDETANVIAALERGTEVGEPGKVLSSTPDRDVVPEAMPEEEEVEAPEEEGSVDEEAIPIERPPGQHHWLLSCPSAQVTGTIIVTTKKGKQTLTLENALGYHDHVWGSGPIGEGFHCRFATRASWPDGAVVCDLPMYGRYVQVAATFMLFHRTKPPTVYRGDRVMLTAPQLSAWLLPLPTEMRWRGVREEVTVHQEASSTIELLAHGARGLATIDLTYPDEEEESAHAARKGMRTVRGLGITELDQYNRMDMPILSRLIERCLFTNPEPSEGRD